MPDLSFVVFNPPGHGQPYLVPSSAFDIKSVERLRWKHGDVITSEFRKPRSGPHHRQVFGGLLRFVFEAQERFDTPEALRCFLTLNTSFCIECVDQATGQVLRFPRSWSYREMDETEFKQLKEELLPVILKEFFPHEGIDWLKASVNQQAFMDGLMSFF
ncbi:hypothetical protein [Cupriavidus basilensis]|uniref:DUF1367 family protein n=1 Tax=Cupriavidus basilensis TaxID=68895 RepID=A0A0C4Y793_9BURK|nr:hypothetical protein [Cupriavidus basilensis]AJG18793.1 hypothetical protein RR42_m1391 [Cupriavidus basilensis]